MIKLRNPPEQTALFPSSRSVSASMWCCLDSGSGSGLCGPSARFCYLHLFIPAAVQLRCSPANPACYLLTPQLTVSAAAQT